MSSNHYSLDVQLVPMAQLAEAKDRGDDWTGIKDIKIRKKLQNRLNVRAHRRRKAAKAETDAVNASTIIVQAPMTEPQEPCWVEDLQAVSVVPARTISAIKPRCPIFPPTTLDSPAHTSFKIVFPLSPDHLITLVQYNALRASMTNLRLLSALHTVPPECSLALRILPVPTYKFPTAFSSTPEQPIPPLLLPTPLQQAVQHEKWINVVPHPVWRDNLIRAIGTYDGYEMRRDILGGLWEGFPDEECKIHGLIAWDTPWCIEGWEVSEGFWRKWGWSLRGVEGALEITNRWRSVRGDEPLVFEV